MVIIAMNNASNVVCKHRLTQLLLAFESSNPDAEPPLPISELKKGLQLPEEDSPSSPVLILAKLELSRKEAASAADEIRKEMGEEEEVLLDDRESKEEDDVPGMRMRSRGSVLRILEAKERAGVVGECEQQQLCTGTTTRS